MFANGRSLIQFFAGQLEQVGRDGHPRCGADRDAEATALLSLLLGLSIAVLLEQTAPAEAVDVLDRHLDRLAG